MLGIEASLNTLGELHFLFGVEQRNLTDLLEIVLDRVGGGTSNVNTNGRLIRLVRILHREGTAARKRRLVGTQLRQLNARRGGLVRFVVVRIGLVVLIFFRLVVDILIHFQVVVDFNLFQSLRLFRSGSALNDVVRLNVRRYGVIGLCA